MSGSRRWRATDPSSDDSDSSIEEIVVVNESIQTTRSLSVAVAASGHNAQGQGPSGSGSTTARRELIARREAHQKELERLSEEMRRIQELCGSERESIQELTRQLGRVPRGGLGDVADADSEIVDYFGRFSWSERLKEQMESVFGIKGFRLSQEGVCNANMHGRDIICIMPTGGGKSLTYQLPATLMPGCTLVFSPLVALIRDQDLHLQEKQIECLTFTAKMHKAEITEGYNRLRDATGKEVKLCYVTPERLAQSDEFRSIIKAMVAANKLARIVIDEAHCISQLGRDYRPQYKQLADLRKLCPRVPILALSATCPPDVLRDLIAILGLRPVTNGAAAEPRCTVLFTSPLYRQNLHYKVLPKSSDHAVVVREMVKYVLERHPNETGIVYCLSRNDAANIAKNLIEESQGRIKTGVYHAEIDDKAKKDLHESWLSGKVKVVCATTAFGLGINKENVRFVLHHSMPKSLETFYQESGRAGRDGKDADCILYYRLLDALRTPGMKANTDWQQQEAHGMIKFSLNLKECRKLQFTKHFSSSDSPWAEDKTPCGHCDNCLRDPASVVEKDVTAEAKSVLAVARALASKNTKATAVQLARTARGNGELAKLLNITRGNKVTLSTHDTEVLIAHLLLEGYLEKFTTENQYTVQVYIKPSEKRHLDEDQKLVVQLQLVLPSDHSSGKKRGRRPRKPAQSPRKKKGDDDNDSSYIDNEEEEEEEEELEEELGEEEEEIDCFGWCTSEHSEPEAGPSESAGGSPAKRRRSNHGWSRKAIVIEDSDQEDNMPGALPDMSRPLTRSMRKRAREQKQKKQGQGASRRSSPGVALLDEEIIEISSD